MFRRKKPVGGFRGPGGPQKPLRSLPPMLLQAHRLFSWRQYLPAAELFEKLAEGAMIREPSRAPQLFLQAGRARIAGGQVDAGVERIRRGLELLFAQQRYTELQRMAWRVILSLENNGLDKQADQIRNWISGLQPTESVKDWNEEPTPRKTKIRLPLSCPACGGVVDPNEVEWKTEDTAECSFCGSMLRGEEA